MRTVCFFPVVADSASLDDLISRAAWFLASCEADRIHLPVASEELARQAWRVAPGMDPEIARQFDALRRKLALTVTGTAEQLGALVRSATVVLRWKKDEVPSFVPPAELSQWLEGRKVLQVDPVAIRQEGSFYIEAGLTLVRNTRALIEENRAKFLALSGRLGHFRRAFVLATGPSVARYRDFDYTDALAIVCNSVILDEDIMDTARPRILVFADPIFHFGPSQYAGAFRQKLRESAARRDFTIFVPFKYYPLFTAVMPELRDRTIAIPFAKDRAFNFDLRNDFQLRTTANILTFLMLPLAGTFADEVCIMGCDGRPLTDNTYFWSHNPSTQINDKMANIREVHPGFFAIDYNDYYLEHCQTLEQQIAEGEAAGRRFLSIGFSHIPALRSRSARGPRRIAATAPADAPVEVVIVDPDATGWSGHYMAYNEKLAQGLQAAGSRVRVLCRRDIDAAILADRPHFVPALETHSWSVGTSRSPAHFERVCANEIAEGVRRLGLPASAQGPITVLYLYVGSIEHARAMAPLLARYPSLHLHVNLFYLPFRDLGSQELREDWRAFFEWADQAGPRFVMTVPTREAQADVLDAFAILLDVAPHPSTGVPDERLGLQPAPKDADGRPLRVLFPGAPRIEKGWGESLACVCLLGGEDGLRTVIRHAPSPSTPEELRVPPSDLPANASVLEGELSNEAYDELFASGDIIVLPYSVQAFGKRTSGLLIDALFHGMPAVVVEGTWLAGVVQRLGTGVVVPDQRPESLRDGVLRLVAEFPRFARQTRDAASRYFRGNNWRALAEFIIRPVRGELAPPPRVLCIDRTVTGSVVAALLHGWDPERLLRVGAEGAGGAMRMAGGGLQDSTGDAAALLPAIAGWTPELVLCRVVDDAAVLAFTRQALSTLGLPWVLHFGDNWPQRLHQTAPDKAATRDAELRPLLAGARARLASDGQLAGLLQARYGVPFQACTATVDPAHYPPRRPRVPGQTMRLVFDGPLADDASVAALARVADALEALGASFTCALEVYTPESCHARAGRALAGRAGVRVHRSPSATARPAALQGADVVLLVFPDDAAGRASTTAGGVWPDCLAAGVPVLAMGPAGLPALQLLQSEEAALVLEAPTPARIGEALRALHDTPTLRAQLVARARSIALERHSVWRQTLEVRALLAHCAAGGQAAPGTRIAAAVAAPARRSGGSGGALAAALGAPRIVGEQGFSELGDGRWRWTPPQPDTPAGTWQAVFPCVRGVRGRTLRARLELRVAQPAVVRATLCRHGGSPFEGRELNVRASPGSVQTVQIDHTFTAEHPAVRLQLAFDPAGGAVEFEVGALTVVETLASVRSAWSAADLGLPQANRLFREGELLTAMCMYLELASHRPLHIYGDNAAWCARRLEWTGTHDLTSLRQRLG